MKQSWLRVRRDRPCPICERPDWCLVAADGSAAICARTESAKRFGDAGWLHRLRDNPSPHRGRMRSIPLKTERRSDVVRLAADCQDAANPVQLAALAHSLGLSVESLRALGIGWSAYYRAWSFPMRHASGAVVGIRLRRPNGSKFAVPGSKEGLFLPTVAGTDERLLICEGPTDAAALLDLSFTAVVGRPSCTGGVKLLVELVQRRRQAETVIVSDADVPGRRGANNLASVLVAYCPLVRVVVPTRWKDVREFLRAGGTREQLEKAITAAAERRLVIRAVGLHGGQTQ